MFLSFHIHKSKYLYGKKGTYPILFYPKKILCLSFISSLRDVCIHLFYYDHIRRALRPFANRFSYCIPLFLPFSTPDFGVIFLFFRTTRRWHFGPGYSILSLSQYNTIISTTFTSALLIICCFTFRTFPHSSSSPIILMPFVGTDYLTLYTLQDLHVLSKRFPIVSRSRKIRIYLLSSS